MFVDGLRCRCSRGRKVGSSDAAACRWLRMGPPRSGGSRQAIERYPCNRFPGLWLPGRASTIRDPHWKLWPALRSWDQLCVQGWTCQSVGLLVTPTLTHRHC